MIDHTSEMEFYIILAALEKYECWNKTLFIKMYSRVFNLALNSGIVLDFTTKSKLTYTYILYPISIYLDKSTVST